jgi:hypothetical protein
VGMVEKGRWWCLGGGGGDGWHGFWILGRRGMEERCLGCVRLAGKNGGEGGKCDLKKVMQDLKPSTFECP